MGASLFDQIWDSAFDEFWQKYPRRIGKLAARKAFIAAIKNHGATLDQLLDGVERYVRHKPGYADWAYPASWLNAGRWADEYDNSNGRQAEPAEDWWAQCKRLHGLKCGGQYAHGLRMQMDAQKTER